ncbi:hypothetical protein AVEN_113103-1 [Araneus ventricosus]|uniref:Tc1-like transposase DDE domain-containing protein n=1 Tax=Araneus ventricosus TaxID=182803 RepID=A0A4Y2RAS5_ARAVE|nr:hypothetical protein AVEN_113103-1 [Araneus ventricosus]
MVQTLKPSDKPIRKEFCVDFQAKLEENGFANRLVFTDESTFHLCGKVNRHAILGHGKSTSHNRTSSLFSEGERFYSHNVFGSFFFVEKSIIGYIFQGMLSEWLFPQLVEVVPGFILQLDDAPPHRHNNVHEYLNDRLPHRWTELAGANDLSMLCWPARSPDLTPCDFFLWCFVKDKVFEPPLPEDSQELKQRITNVLNALTGNLLSRVWQELYYRVDIGVSPEEHT